MANEERAARACHKCDQHDDHPRHIVYLAFRDPRDPKGEKVIDLTTEKHLDCCAEDGCGICATDLEFVPDKKGLELATALQNKSDEHLAALRERHRAAVPGNEFTPEEAHLFDQAGDPPVLTPGG